MTRTWLPLCGLAALCACQPAVPDSAAGVGFGSYSTYDPNRSPSLARQAQLQTPLVLSPETTGAPVATGGDGTQAISAAELAAAGIRIEPSTRVTNAAGQILYGPAPQGGPSIEAPVVVSPVPPGTVISTSTPAAEQPGFVTGAAVGAAAEPGAPVTAIAPVATGAATISDEQDFRAVATRETIESDAQRRAAQAAQFQEVVVPAVPDRPADTGADVVAFALATSHPLGQKVYDRPFGGEAKAARACARFTSTDIAQRAFLEAGGPERDRIGVDPDGDGYACAWNPEPFRKVRG